MYLYYLLYIYTQLLKPMIKMEGLEVIHGRHNEI